MKRAGISNDSLFHVVRYGETLMQYVQSKIEKVPRGIQGEKSSKDKAGSMNLVSTIGDKA